MLPSPLPFQDQRRKIYRNFIDGIYMIDWDGVSILSVII